MEIMIDKKSRKNILLRIARHLILNTSFMDNIGLFHGKMGVVIFFVHYSQYTGESIYDKYAEELIDEICEKIHYEMPINFENGLSGIGWGILYLLTNGFMEGSPNEILVELDSKIMEMDLSRVKDMSVRTGLLGISSYINKRINYSRILNEFQPFDTLYLNNWRSLYNGPCLSDKEMLDHILFNISKNNQIESYKLGLEKGLAGWGLKKILK